MGLLCLWKEIFGSEWTDGNYRYKYSGYCPYPYPSCEGQEANCTAAGNKEYWDCSVCGKKFSDQNGQTEIADADIIIPVKTHTLTHHARQEADCLTDGTIEYWSCDVCNKLFADSDGKKEVTDIKVSAKGHDYGAWGVTETGRIPIAARHLAVVLQKQRIVSAALPLIRKKLYVQYVEINMENCCKMWVRQQGNKHRNK